jgi:parvulin-like peptidyl-prolyl isomerase
MAIIGKIREKSGLLVGIVGLALLAFVLGDYQSMFGNSEGKYGIGLVYGNKVNADTYYGLSSRVQQQERTQAEQEQKEFGENEMAAASNKAWEFMVDSILLHKEYEALGISVSDKEFNAYILATDGFPVLQDLAKFFTDSITGAVTEQSTITGRQKLQETITQLKTSKEAGAKQQWEGTKKYYTDRRKREKYFALLEQGVYVTKLEAQQEYQAQKETKNISFVQRLYSEISDVDAGIKVNDTELRAYFEAHKKDAKYQNLFSSREVKLFEVAIKASKKDTAKFSNDIMKLKADFLASTNDSLFVMKESENKVYFGDKRGTAVPKGHEKANRFMTYPPDYDTIFKRATIGQLVGPYSMDEKMYVSKVIGFTPSKLKARHLLISTKDSKDPNSAESKDPKFIAAKKKLADSLLTVINKDNFSALVTKYSDDPGSKDKGGLYENFLEGEMVGEFGGFCANNPVGKIAVVKTDFGFHIIEILEKGSSKFPVLTTIVKSFKPSEESITAKEDEVNELRDQLEQKIKKIEDLYAKIVLFDTLVRKANYMVGTIEIKDDEPTIPGLRNERSTDKILELAYGEDVTVGTMISYPIKEKDRFIIAMVSAIKEKGEPLYEQVKGKMEKELIKEKKAKRLMNQMAKTKDLAVLAKQGNTSVMEAQITFANPSLGNAGSEPEIVGSLFSAIKDGQTTLPLKGEMGVYMIKVIKTTKAPATNTYKVERDQLLNTAKSSIQRNVVSALKKKAEVIDNRKLYNLRIRL